VASFDDERVSYERLLSTVPLDVLGKLLVDLPPDVRDAFAKLRCTELYYLDVALDAPLLRDLHWVYVPERKYPFYRVGCYSHFSAEMAPPGKACLYIELASRERPDLATLSVDVAAHLTEMGLISSPSDVRFMRLRHIAHAYVIYDRNHDPALSIIRAFLDAAGIISTGRYGGWNYSSMEDALLFGRDAARALTKASP
jgi:protoporphyrinogen oxidase